LGTTRQPYKTLDLTVAGDKRKTKPKIPKHLKMAPAAEANTKYIEVRLYHVVVAHIN
jgi:hypothetical protein